MKVSILAMTCVLAACTGVSESQLSQGLVDDAPLHQIWMRGSHNTYEKDATPWKDSTIANHLAMGTRHIELDLRDTVNNLPTLSGQWWIAHGLGGPVTEKCGVRGFTLSACLAVIRDWHQGELKKGRSHDLIIVWLDKKQNFGPTRTPFRLDEIISDHFSDAELLTPSDLLVDESLTLRENVMKKGWPLNSSLQNQIMFVIAGNEPDNCTGNDRLQDYVVARGAAAKAFIAPTGMGKVDYVTDVPECFTKADTAWVVFYDFKWESPEPGNDCETNNTNCIFMREAHCRKFLTRTHDIDDPGESDGASEGPFQGEFGYSNFIPVDRPWIQNGDHGVGNFPEGIYPVDPDGNEPDCRE